MVIKTNWPGASAEEVSRQITERIEKKLMETGDFDKIVSFSRPGESQVTFIARDSMHSNEIPDLWYQVRKKVNDIRYTLPQGIQGPFFNDEFGTTFGNIYALTGEGFDYAVMKDYADRVQLQLQRVKDVGKVELIGLQDEKVWDRTVQRQGGHARSAYGCGAEGAGGAERGSVCRLLRNPFGPCTAAGER